MRLNRKPDIGYIPTEPEAVIAALGLAETTRADVVYDLGCGDGRIVITAAQKFGSRGVGLDIDSQWIQGARANAEQAGVRNLVEFRQQDLFTANFSDATVVFLYLLPHLNLRLLPELLRQLQPGSRIVSRDFDLGTWEPERVVQVRSLEEPTLYCWVVP